MFCKKPSAVFVLATVVLATGCGRDPEVAKREYLERGSAFAAEKKYPEAIIELAATQVDAQYGEARMKLAEAYAATGEHALALAEYVRAADVMPGDVQAQVKAGEMLLLARRFEDAEDRAQKALELEPKRTDALILHANALAGLKRLEEAVAELEEAMRQIPGKETATLISASSRWRAAIENSPKLRFKKAVETARAPSMQGWRWQITTGRQGGKRRPAELKAALALDPNQPLANHALAMFSMGSRRGLEAEPHLKVLAKLSGQGKLTLADYYVKARRAAEAQAVLEEVVKTDPANSPAAKLRLARLDMSAGDKPGAVRTIDEVVAAHPTNIEALVSRAGVLAEEGKHDGALEVLKKALAVDARSPSVHFALGKLHLLRRDTTAALGAFGQVVKMHPRNSAAQFELARLHLFDDWKMPTSSFRARCNLLRPTLRHGSLRPHQSDERQYRRSETSEIAGGSAPGSPAVQTEQALIGSVATTGRRHDHATKVIMKAPGFSEAAVCRRHGCAGKALGSGAGARHEPRNSSRPTCRCCSSPEGCLHPRRRFDAAEGMFRRALELDPNA